MPEHAGLEKKRDCKGMSILDFPRDSIFRKFLDKIQKINEKLFENGHFPALGVNDTSNKSGSGSRNTKEVSKSRLGLGKKMKKNKDKSLHWC